VWVPHSESALVRVTNILKPEALISPCGWQYAIITERTLVKVAARTTANKLLPKWAPKANFTLVQVDDLEDFPSPG
jgi:hypothetical protein